MVADVSVEQLADPPRRRTQAERRATTRGALLEATLDLLVEVGYASLTTSQVVARAGVSRGAQAHYFATKQDLVVQALSHLTDKLVADMIAQPLRSVDGERAQFESLLNRLWEIYAGPASTALTELFVAARTDPELREQLLVFDQQAAKTMEMTARTVAPGLVDRPGFRNVMVTSLATIRGLWLLRAVASERQVRRLWPAARAQLLAGFPAPPPTSSGER